MSDSLVTTRCIYFSFVSEMSFCELVGLLYDRAKKGESDEKRLVYYFIHVFDHIMHA